MKPSFSGFARKTAVAIFTIALIAGISLFASGKSKAKKEIEPAGIYAVIEGRPAVRSKGYVQLEVFSSFYCGHCYNFFTQENILSKRHKIKFVHIPIQWGEGSAKATEAYLIARDMGKGDEMRSILFDSKFIENKDISDIEWLKKTASALGLDKKFGKILDSGVKAKAVSENLNLIRQLSINATPTVIVGGNMVVVPDMTGGNMNVFVMNIDKIVGSLLGDSEW